MDIFLQKIDSKHFRLVDHAGGFDKNLRNSFLDTISSTAATISTEYLGGNWHVNYPQSRFTFDYSTKSRLLGSLAGYSLHPDRKHKNFMCSFNGSGHVSRKLLVAALHRFGWFDPRSMTKNFIFSVDEISGHIQDYYDSDQKIFYGKFFIDKHSEEFFQSRNSLSYARIDHASNIYSLEHKLTDSFLHLVSETLATSYYPFVTEKFLYSVVTRGLFISYAQPGWHQHLEQYFGFRKYHKIFDYHFDHIQNPVERLIALISMLAKFSMLSSADWNDLYQLETETIEYNYDHYFSKKYLSHLKQHSLLDE